MNTERNDYLPAGDVIKQSFQLWLRSILPVLPLSIILALFATAIHFDFITPLLSRTEILIYSVVTFLIQWFIAAVIFNAVQDILNNQKPNFAAAIQKGKKFYVHVLLAGIMISVLTGLGMTFAAIPGIILSIYSILVLPCVALEGTNPVQALKQTMRLLRHHWWKTLAVAILPFICLFLAALLVKENDNVLLLSALIVMTILLPWQYATTLCIFQNLKNKPLDTPYEKRYSELLDNKPKALKNAALLLFIYALITMGVYLFAMLSKHPINFSLPLSLIFFTLIHHLQAPGALLCIPVTFGAYSYFGSSFARIIWIIASIVTIVIYAGMLLHPDTKIAAHSMYLELVIIAIINIVLNIAITWALFRSSTKTWFADMKANETERCAQKLASE